MSFLFIEFNFCPREQRKSNCENHFHMFMLLSTEKLRNSYYYQIIQKKLFNLFFWHFLWLHAFNQVYNSDKTFPIHNEFSSGVPACFQGIVEHHSAKQKAAAGVNSWILKIKVIEKILEKINLEPHRSIKNGKFGQKIRFESVKK